MNQKLLFFKIREVVGIRSFTTSINSSLLLFGKVFNLKFPPPLERIFRTKEVFVFDVVAICTTKIDNLRGQRKREDEPKNNTWISKFR